MQNTTPPSGTGYDSDDEEFFLKNLLALQNDPPTVTLNLV